MTNKNSAYEHLCSAMKAFLFTLLITTAVYSQTERWIYTYNGSGNGDDVATSIVFGLDCNIYVAGMSSGSGTGEDFTVASLKTSGDTNWVYRYDGPVNGEDLANAVAYGADGNIYAAGFSTGNSTDADFTVMSLKTSGDTNWVYRYNGPGNGGDCANAIVYGTDGNIYAAGYSGGNGTGADFTVISLRASGDTNWVYRYDGTGNDADVANSIGFGADGNIYAAGCITGELTAADFAVVSLDTTGIQKWIYMRDGTNLGTDIAYSIVYGADNNIYAAGDLDTTIHTFTVISIDTIGAEQWTFMYGVNPYWYNAALCIAYGLDGNLYAGGFTNGPFDDFAVMNLTTRGDTNWTYTHNGPGNDLDAAWAIIYGADDNIYAAGYSTDIDYYYSATIISLTTSGDTNWVYRYNGPGYGDDWVRSIVYGTDGNIYAAGYGAGSGTNGDFTVISLNPISNIEENSSVTKHDIPIRVLSTFFNKEISIGFANSSELPLKVAFYNILGSRVYETSFPSTPLLLCLNDRAIARLPEGIYFLSISQGEKPDIVTKMIKP